MRIEASSSFLVLEKGPRIPRKRPCTIDTRASRDGLEGSCCITLVITCVEWIGSHAGEERGRVDDNPIHPNVVVRRYKRRYLGTELRIGERPSAEARTLGSRITNPSIREAQIAGGGGGSGEVVGAAGVHAEVLNGNVIGGEDEVNATGVYGKGVGGERGEKNRKEDGLR